MSITSIPWTDFTFNPWWGCTKISPECANCYAESWAKRTGHAVWGPSAGRRFFADAHFEEPLRWNDRAALERVRRRVFVASMADVFEWPKGSSSLSLIVEMGRARAKLWETIEACPALDWLLLTKRPENFGLAPWFKKGKWPSNVWLGVTAGTQERANEVVPLLLESRARTLFVSYEPALELVDFGNVAGFDALTGWTLGRSPRQKRALDWIIVGGESGTKARPFDPAWARATVAACRDAGVAVFVKQLGARPVQRAPDGTELLELDVRGRDRKGENPDFWPVDLRVREFPRSSEAA